MRLNLAYDGRGFRGFAAQAVGVRTVAGVLSGAIQRVLRTAQPPALTCAGRTDAGVHAWDQWVHFDAPRGTDPTDLQRRLVKLLAPEIVVRHADQPPAGWDARHSAIARTYRYAIRTSATPSPFDAGLTWWVPGPLDMRAMQLAADVFVGPHDFASFCRAMDGTLQRTVQSATWSEPDEDMLRFEITANAFCQQMVRSIVGLLVEVGRGKRAAGDTLAVLKAGDRAYAAPPAPPDGLVLWKVDYPAESST